jgi:hypothetical protein
MNKIERLQKATIYDTDYALWCSEQGALLREGRLSDLDRENLAEEIESLGGSERDEIESRLDVLVMHLLKWRFQPEGRSSGWKGTIVEQRRRLERRLNRSPSLKFYPAEILTDVHESARLLAAGETGLPEDAFPETCPFTVEQILNTAFYPEAE